MKVLIGCEESQAVTKEFRKLGHEAFSCDIQDCSGGHPEWHLKGNIFDFINDGWDLMIAHPPCTYLSSAGLHHCNIETKGRKAIDRIKKRNKAIEFFLDLWDAPIDRICLENPTGHISSTILKPTQIIHPYFFGDQDLKRTCLWLKNLPALEYRMTNDLFGEKTASDYPPPIYTDHNGKKRYYTDANHGSFQRSKTFPAIAKAMAEQWGEIELMSVTKQ